MLNMDMDRKDDMTVEYDPKTSILTISIKIDPVGEPSKNSGKLMMLGSSHGWKTVDVESTLAISLNVGRKPHGRMPE